MPRLYGTRILVTAGASRLGLAIGRHCLSLGARVVCARAAPPSIDDGLIFDQADVCDPASFAGLIARTADRWGGLDALVMSADAIVVSDLERLGAPALRAMVDTNIVSTVQQIQAAIPVLRASGGGSIITQSSRRAHDRVHGTAACAATLAAIEELTVAVAPELARDHIRINCLTPVFTNHDMSPGLTTDERSSRSRRAGPIGTLDDPDVADIVRLASFLASNESDQINGAVLVMDPGGR